MSASVMVSLNGVTRAWSETPAVDNLSLDVTEGEFVILLGPSGCGKSTTLRLIAGLESADNGQIAINGKDVTNAPPQHRELSMVFQSYALFPHLNVADNIVFGLKSRRVPRQDRRRKLNHVAEIVGLEELLSRKPAQLSGGQRQRVALARAIVAEHPICLMDEPLSNLDARLRSEMRREIRELQQRLGMTVIYVTHDQVEAMSMGDRIVLLEQGRLVQDDAPQALYEHPRSIFAGKFIGSPPMNVVDLEEHQGAAAIPGTDGTPLGVANGHSMTLGLRPEAIAVTADIPGSAGLPGQLTDIEYLGSEVILGIQAGERRLLVKANRVPSGLTINSPCRLQWAAEATHFFASDSGRRIETQAYSVGDSPRFSITTNQQ